MSVPVKGRKDKYYKAISGTMQRTFEIFVFIHSYPTSTVLCGNKCLNPAIPYNNVHGHCSRAFIVDFGLIFGHKVSILSRIKAKKMLLVKV